MSNKKSKTPLVTVVTICFNPLKHGRSNAFQVCINSIKNQTYPNVEHLIIDGNSQDGTVEFIKKNAAENDRIRWISEKDRGIYDAMNKGIREAKGEYILFINTDDALTYIDSLSSMVAAILKDNGDFLYANADVYDENHTALQRTWYSSIDEMPYGYYPCHQTLLAKTSVLREIGGFTEKYMANDNLLMLKLVARNYKPVYLNRVVADFHLGGASGDMIASAERMRKEHVEFFYEEYGKKNGLTKDDCNYLYIRSYTCLPWQQAIELGIKLRNERWQRNFFHHYLQHVSDYFSSHPNGVYRNVKIRLFGIIPLFSVRSQGDFL